MAKIKEDANEMNNKESHIKSVKFKAIPPKYNLKSAINLTGEFYCRGHRASDEKPVHSDEVL